MISTSLNIRPRGSGGQLVGQYTFSSSAMTSMIIVKASDVAPKTLLRTLWSEEQQDAGASQIVCRVLSPCQLCFFPFLTQ